MKTRNFLLTLAGLGLAVVSTQASTLKIEGELVQLPVHRVEAAQYTPAEKQVETSLQALRNAPKLDLNQKAPAKKEPASYVAKPLPRASLLKLVKS